MLPKEIQNALDNDKRRLDRLGCSGARVLIFADRVLKIEKECNSSVNEAKMMQWLKGRLQVPDVIASAAEDGVRYLLMSRVPGTHLCEERILDDQDLLAELISESLNSLWKVDISDCPTDRSLQAVFQEIEEGLRTGTITMDSARQEETFGPGGFRTAEELFEWLVKNQPKEDLVLSHGDFCLPNIYCNGTHISGIIDLGYAGIADKWVDIEKAVWSIWANTAGVYSKKKREFDRNKLFRRLNMFPDEDRLRYFSLLSELC